MRDNPEATLIHAIAARFGGDPRLRIWRLNVGAAQQGSRFVRFGFPGLSDFLGLVRTGRLIAIEAKSERGRQSDAQRVFQSAIESMCGLYVVARSVADIEIILERECPSPTISDAPLRPF